MEKISHENIKEMMLKASEMVSLHKEEINNVNIFPVPDSDTGTNLAQTLLGIKNSIKNVENGSIIPIILENALLSSQGNSGIVLTAFLKGFLGTLRSIVDINITDISKGFADGYIEALGSIQNPLDGTMIDVIKELSETFIYFSSNEMWDIKEAFNEVLPILKKSVFETLDHMKLLKDNNVVDAGALGFYFVIKGFGVALGVKNTVEEQFVNKRTLKRHTKSEIKDHIYEVVAILTIIQVDSVQIHELLSPHGNCLDIIEVEGKTKIHIHTDEPHIVKEIIEITGEVDSIYIVDMRTNALHVI